jgi:hypothetical protein
MYVLPHLALPLAACSVVMPLAQEIKKEMATMATKDNTILLVMILGFLRFKKEIQ